MATFNPYQAPLARDHSTLFSKEAKKQTKKQTALAHLEEYLSRPIDDKPFVADDTLKERDRLWQNWTQFCEDLAIDSQTTWLTFVKRPETAEAQAPFRAFLRTYAETSTQKRPILGPEEYESKRMVNSAFSLTEVWRRLVASGEHHIMRQQRRDYPTQAETWRLRWISKEEGSREGPAYRIVKWLFVELAPEIGLETVPTYEKTEMTSIDVDVALYTLWSRASDIPCKPVTRVSFHANVLLAATGGFRPEKPTRTKVVVTVNIKRNKIKETSKTSRSRNGGWISFSITLVPRSSFCLASLVLARAVQDDAFDPSFSTVEEIFDRPNLESVDFIPLKWKQDFLNKPIFPMAYKTLNELWHRTLLVAGFRNHSRLYSLRVGAGARFDDVFESNYQSHRIRANLMFLAFGNDAGRDEQLFAMLRDMSMSRDTNAPVDIDPGENRELEWRQDVINLRHDIDIAKDSKERTRLRAKLNNLLKTLWQLKLEDKRARYFERVDYLRAQGLSTMDTYSRIDNNVILPPDSTATVSQALKVHVNQQAPDRDVHSRHYITSLLRYLTNAPIGSGGKEEGEDEAKTDGVDGLQKKQTRCLLCGTNDI
ncbi:hypothetical protein DL771_008954 [Monosporascus sp. 5C6A]|nr:hypothetical protein DL771_008954 [Monosporascus sp. 5C6A]